MTDKDYRSGARKRRAPLAFIYLLFAGHYLRAWQPGGDPRGFQSPARRSPGLGNATQHLCRRPDTIDGMEFIISKSDRMTYRLDYAAALSRWIRKRPRKGLFRVCGPGDLSPARFSVRYR